MKTTRVYLGSYFETYYTVIFSTVVEGDMRVKEMQFKYSKEGAT